MKKLPNLGIMGEMGSGKGFASKYLSRKYGYRIITMGNFARALARKEHMKPSRENLEKLQKKYSKKGDFIMEKVLEEARESKKPVILDGIRKPSQAKMAMKELGVVLVDIEADPEIRFERMKKRGRKSGFPRTFEAFKKIEAREEKVFHIRKALGMAKYRINNGTDTRKFYKDLSSLMKKVRK